jgi:hypothetical protein
LGAAALVDSFRCYCVFRAASAGSKTDRVTKDLASAICKEDFNAFNELMKQVPPLTLKIFFHYPGLREPSLTEDDIEGLSKFIKPKVE